MTADFEFDASILSKIDEHKSTQDLTNALAFKLITSRDGVTFIFDLLALAALKRSLALQTGFRQMIVERNSICAGALLRLQLDTSIRMYGAWLVRDADEYAEKVLRGEKISGIRTVSGEKLTDRFLANELGKKYPWVPKLYDACCEYVHFSSLHISALFDGIDQENAVAHVKVSHIDSDLPDSYYIGALVDSISCTTILHELVYARIDQRESVPSS